MTCDIPSQSHNNFIISNASHSMHCSSVELVSSESTVPIFVTLLSNVMPNRLHRIFTCANNCGRKSVHIKCPKWLLEQISSYSDYFNAISGLYRTAELQEAL